MDSEYYLPEPKEFTDEELDGFDQLSTRIRKFCHYYAKERRPYRSAVKAGYPKKYAQQKAMSLLRDPIVKRYIEYLQKRIAQLGEIDRNYIVLKLKSLVESKDTSDNVKVSALNTLAKMGGFLHEQSAPQTFIFNVLGLSNQEDNQPYPVNSQFDSNFEDQ